MRILFIGTVAFSYDMLELLLKKGVNVVGIITREISYFHADFKNLMPLGKHYHIPVYYCKDVNCEEAIEWMCQRKPDIIFCFGWPYLLKSKVLSLASKGVLGYHPAELPMNRGRHPIIWALALGLKRTASTFFFMDEGADSGDIISQVRVAIKTEDDAQTLYRRLSNIASKQIVALLPILEKDRYVRKPQDRSKANLWRKRNEEDGLIDWRMSNTAIFNLVRALTHPYVGAHFYFNSNKIIVWRVKALKLNGFYNNIEPGKVLFIKKHGPVIKCGGGCVQLIEMQPLINLKPGTYLLI